LSSTREVATRDRLIRNHQECGRTESGCRVAPAGCPAGALTRSGQGDFHHPALPAIRLTSPDPRCARTAEAGGEGTRAAGPRTAPRSVAHAGSDGEATCTKPAWRGTAGPTSTAGCH